MHDPRSPRRTVRVSLRVIQRLYGAENFDAAGDAIGDALREVSEHPGQYEVAFDFDTAHPNPWFHALMVTSAGVPDAVHERFLAELVRLGLLEAGGR